ncbi:MAG: hypothetical protein PHE43_03535 [Candidatus Nanoarchaeia archaeon]|nr:hypothetical protein [Candidatus Nanoarchaeia archaeon]
MTTFEDIMDGEVDKIYRSACDEYKVDYDSKLSNVLSEVLKGQVRHNVKIKENISLNIFLLNYKNRNDFTSEVIKRLENYLSDEVNLESKV